MKKLSRIFLVFFATAVAFSQASTLKGIIEIAEEDEQHHVTAVNLMVDKIIKGNLKTEYIRIINKGKGAELLNHVDKEVEITGTVKGRGLNKQILVKDYEILSSEEEQEPNKAEAPTPVQEVEKQAPPPPESSPEPAAPSEPITE